MSSEEDKMPLRRENTLAPLEKVPEELMDQVVEHAEAKRVADLPIIERVREGIEDVTTQISDSLKEAVTSSNDKQEENSKETQETQEKPEKKESPKNQEKPNDPSQELKHKLESGEKIKASELASEFIHFIQEESRGSDDQNPKKQEQKGEHHSLLQTAEEGVKTIVRRLSQTLEDMKEKLHSSREGSAAEQDEQHPHHPSFKEIALGFVHEIKDDMTLQYDQEYTHKAKQHGKSLEKKLAKFISHDKPIAETAAETQPSKSGEVASIHQVNPAELKGFTTVQSGRSESETKPQQEEKETKKEEENPLLTSSKNPFDILMEEDNLNVVAGEGIGADVTNKVSENEPSSFKEKAKGKIENVSSKISNKVHAAKNKASATFKEADKENAPQVA